MTPARWSELTAGPLGEEPGQGARLTARGPRVWEGRGGGKEGRRQRHVESCLSHTHTPADSPALGRRELGQPDSFSRATSRPCHQCVLLRRAGRGSGVSGRVVAACRPARPLPWPPQRRLRRQPHPPDYAHQPAVLLRSCVSQRPHCSPPQVTSSPYSPREPPEDKDVKLRHTLRDLASESTRPATSNSSEGGAEGWREGGRAHPRRRRNLRPASPGCPQGRAVFVDRTQGHPEPCAGRTPGRSSHCYCSTKFGCPSGSGF